MIIRLSIIPFDFGDVDIEKREAALRERGFVESRRFSQADRQIVGLSMSRWDREDDLSVFIEHRGFGVLIERDQTDVALGDHHAIADLLVERQEIHSSVRKGGHPVSHLIRDLRDQVAPTSGFRFRQVTTARWNVWDGIPYVFTYFVDEDVDPASLSGQEIQSLRALSEPSIIGCGDNDPISSSADNSAKEIAQQIAGLPSHRDELHDVDINDNVHCSATWAGLVVLGREGERGSTKHTYELLEIRTQVAWSASYSVRRWCERSLSKGEKINSSIVEDLRWQVMPLLHETIHLSEAALSTRHRRILQALSSTSSLEREVSSTEHALRRLSEVASRHESKRRSRFEGAVEVLLGVIALLQLVSLIHEGPLISVSTAWATGVVVAGGLLIGLGITVSRR